MTRRNREQHVDDSPLWRVTQTARQADEIKQAYIEAMAGGETSVMHELIKANFEPQFRPIVLTYLQNGAPEELAHRLALSELNQHEVSTPQWAPSPGDPIGSVANRLIDTSVENLRAGRVFILDPDMQARTVAATDALSYEDLQYFQADDLPAPAGFVVFPETVIFEHSADIRPDPLIAVSWRVTTMNLPSQNGDRFTRIPALIVLGWLQLGHELIADSTTYLKDVAAQRGERIPPISPAHRSYFGLPVDLPNIDIGDESTMTPINLPANEETSSGQFVSGESIRGVPVGSWILKYVMALSRLVTQPRQATVKRYRDGIDPRVRYSDHHDVRIIQARPLDNAGHRHAQRRPRSYQTRWTVRMHKVNQYYASEDTHRIIFRGPYVKGPRDAPIKETKKVWAVVSDPGDDQSADPQQP